MHTTRPFQRSALMLGATLFALAFLPRVVNLLFQRPVFETIYWELATGLLTDGSLSLNQIPTTDYEPMYPLFLAASRWLVGDHAFRAQVVQVAVASVGALLMYGVGRRLSGSSRTGIVAAVLYAGYPILIRHSADDSDAALTATLTLAFVYTSIEAPARARTALAAGLWLGLAALTRMMMLPLVAIGAVLLVAGGHRRSALAFVIGASTLITPYVVRNYALNGALLPTRGGLNLYTANSEYVVMPQHAPDILNGYALSIVEREGPDGLDGPALARQQDVTLRQLAVAYIAAHPHRTARTWMWNVWYFFTPRLVPYHELGEETEILLGENSQYRVLNAPPRRRLHQIVYSVSYTAVLVAALAGLYARRARLRQDLMLWGVLATFLAAHTILYVPTPRYSVPIAFIWLFYAAVGLEQTWRLARRSATRRAQSLTTPRRQ